ncbi:MAG: heme utilization cystosolic carrier protein HutX [Hyphomicrobiaceae bacterium]
MSVASASDGTSLAERLAENPDGVLERIAAEHGVSTRDVVAALPEAHQSFIAGDRFQEVMTALEAWGEVLFIVHTPDIVLECVGRIPPGTIGRGYYNLHGDSPIGGHIRYESCDSIAFVSRPFMGRQSCSIQFFNAAGEAMFKVFVRRDAERNLLQDQVALFEALRTRLAG